ncbi:uncharacterized protein [Physcomitrium patens]|uniref:uncharacterized protein isoform X2 n=1 Tax=Physcomitrium patens TaxID=3218 RepID=UPI003CCCAB2C
MVTSRVVVDEGRCKDQADLAMSSSRTLVYDVETRSLRHPKFTLKACPKSSMLNSSSSSFKVVKDQLGDVCHLGQRHSGVGSGPYPRSMENDSIGGRENGGAISHYTSRGETKESQTPPFKSIQSAVAEKTVTEFKKKKKLSSIPASQSANIMSRSPGIFSFNAAYISEMEDFDQTQNDSLKEANHVHRCYVQRSNTATLLRPIPSKWDDAEKWLPGSDQISNARTKARSGPMLARMLASQGIMSKTWKESPCGPQHDRCFVLGQRFVVRDGASIKHLTAGTGGDILRFPANEKEKFKMMVKQYSRPGLQPPDGISSSELNGSNLNVGTQVEIPLLETSPSTRAVGTSMTPVASVEPSRPGTPARTTIAPEKMSVNVQGSSSEYSENDAETTSKYGISEPPRMLTDKEFQERTRLEIVALGTLLGKTKIAAWAASEENFSPISSTKAPSESTDGPGDGFATRAATWEKAEDMKFNSSSQQEEGEVQEWEEHKRAKAEAKLRRVEIKTERMRFYAHEKLSNKLADARHHAETLRLAARTRRAEAASKAANKAEVNKTSSKFLNLMFLTSFCK